MAGRFINSGLAKYKITEKKKTKKVCDSQWAIFLSLILRLKTDFVLGSREATGAKPEPKAVSFASLD